MGSQVRSKAVTNGIIVNVDDTNGVVTYMGFTLRETAGSTAVVRIRQGGATGLILDDIGFAASEAVADYYSPDGKRCEGDLYCEIVSGTLEGSIHWE